MFDAVVVSCRHLARTVDCYYIERPLLKNGSGNLLNRRWKKQDFAERLGRHPDTISNWANGKTAPNDFDLKAIIQLLQLSEQEGKEFEVLRDEAAVLLETKRSQRRRELAAVGQPSVGCLSEDDEDMPINRRTFLGAGLIIVNTHFMPPNSNTFYSKFRCIMINTHRNKAMILG